jgi:4-hydroxy-2-oxoheptanedioate aldolase
MRPNTVKQKWREGKVAVGGWCQIGNSYTAEIMANAGFDWVGIDTQHGAIDYSTAFPMLQAISTTPTMPFVRVPWNEPSIIMKYLDAGAYGIIVPMISSAADAKAAVRACRYPPDGVRSFGPNRVNLYSGGFTPEEANREVALVLMIETAEALKNLDAIAAVPGVDALYIGPSDLNQALGLPPRGDPFDPRHFEAAERIRLACEAHRIVAGVHTWGAAIASRWIRQGFKMVMLANDTMHMMPGLRAELAGIAEALAESGK